jgi:hypothetical protein
LLEDVPALLLITKEDDSEEPGLMITWPLMLLQLFALTPVAVVERRLLPSTIVEHWTFGRITFGCCMGLLFGCITFGCCMGLFGGRANLF